MSSIRFIRFSALFSILLLMLLGSTAVQAQYDDLYDRPSTKTLVVKNSVEVLGRNESTGQDIVAKVYELPERIYSVYLDSITGYLMFQIRGTNKKETYWNTTGSLVQYDAQRQQVLWTRSMNYLNNYLFQVRSHILLNKANNSACLDPWTGETRWVKKAQVVTLDSACKVGVGMKENVEFAQTTCVYGIDLSSGEELWKRYIPFEYGQKPFFTVDDSTVIFVSAGLHQLNLHTGAGWSYGNSWAAPGESNQPAHTRDLKRFPSQTFYVSTNKVNVWGIHSNLFRDSLGYYFVHKATIVRLSNDGHVLWKNQMDEWNISETKIVLDTANVYVINDGMGHDGYVHVRTGKPFLAKFRRSDGELVYENMFKKAKGPLRDFFFRDSVFYGLFSDRIQAYSYETGNFLFELPYKNNEGNTLQYFISEAAWAKQDRLFKTLHQTDSLHLYAYTDKGKIVRTDPKLQAFTEFTDSLYSSNLIHEDFSVIVRNGNSYLVDSTGNIYGSLKLSYKAMFYKNIVIDTQLNKFYILDLEALKKKENG